MLVVDAAVLILMFETNEFPWVERAADRVKRFIADTSDVGEEIVIPAPVLAEVVAGRIERVEEIMAEISRHRAMSVQPLDQVIAIETGYLIKAALDRRPPGPGPEGWKVMMKYDAMIAATARVRRARAVVTADGGFGPYLDGSGVGIIRLADLPLPAPKHPDLFDPDQP